MSIENKSKREILENEYRNLEDTLQNVQSIEYNRRVSRMKEINEELEKLPYDAVIQDKGPINLETVVQFKTVDNQLNFSLIQNSRKQWFSPEDHQTVGLTTTIEVDANNMPTKILRTFQDSDTFKNLGNKVLTKVYTANYVAKPKLPEPKPFLPSGMGLNSHTPQLRKIIKFSKPEELSTDVRPPTKQEKQKRAAFFGRFKSKE